MEEQAERSQVFGTVSVAEEEGEEPVDEEEEVDELLLLLLLRNVCATAR